LHLFYTPDIDQDIYHMDETESGHCIRVLRLKKGDVVHLIDGRGGFYSAIIEIPDHRRCIVKVIEKQADLGKRNYSLHLAVAPTKSIERFEWLLEKATEIGVDEITPLLCEHSERKHVRTDRLMKIITSSIKQSISAYHPKLNEMTSFNDFINIEHKGQKFVAHCYNIEKVHVKHRLEPNSGYTILIGPEGDFSEEEVRLALKSGYEPISLGNSRLRTETAGVVACHAVAMVNEK
jgi:16S rRNA (uracil1498-N3)-methyltransferase